MTICTCRRSCFGQIGAHHHKDVLQTSIKYMSYTKHNRGQYRNNSWVMSWCTTHGKNSDQKATFAKSGPMRYKGVILTPITCYGHILHVHLFLISTRNGLYSYEKPFEVAVLCYFNPLICSRLVTTTIAHIIK